MISLLSKSKSDKQKAQGFGTFKGVFTPSILTILGVIMYLRLGWILGNVGLLSTLVIVTLATTVTFITGLSISATATNMKVKGGGAYYMISRSLGVEAGAAVGIPLFLAQALGISFYITGFSETLVYLLPQIPQLWISITSLVLLAAVAFLSTDLALKTQFLILTIIILSLISFFMGSSFQIEISAAEATNITQRAGFWTAFAIFFPAVTGIEAGLSMSGDLKRPSKSLPLGTIFAVLIGYIVYLTIPIFLSTKTNHETLMRHPMIMQDIAKWSIFISLGVWGATLSSALGALLGAPRTLQALAKDKIFPAFIGKGSGKDDNPQTATIISFTIALLGIMMNDLNTIAPVLSMFFLTSYGVLNFSAGFEGMIANPSWRPKFKIPWLISIAGGFLCFAVMFMINAGATITSIILTLSVYYYMQRRNLTAHWGDVRRGILLFLARSSISRLAQLKENTKTWRPNILVLSGTPTKRWYLIELADAISHGKGFMTVATILPKDSSAINRIPQVQKSIEEFLNKKNVPALVRLSVADEVLSGVVSLVRDYGLGPIVPNTIILGETENENNFEIFAEMLIRIYQAKRNIVIVRETNLPAMHHDKKRIDVWWGRERHNAGLSLALGYMLQSSDEWQGASLHLNSIVTDDDSVDKAGQVLKNILKEGRLEAQSEVFAVDIQEGNKQSIFDRIKRESIGSQLVFLGMLPPDLEKFKLQPDVVIKEYAEYYKSILDRTRNFPPLAIVLAAEEIDFHKIFAAD